MKAIQLYLVTLLIGLGTYTLLVGQQHGWHLLPIFFSDIQSMSWNGQFNFDFMTFLSLSGLWVAWRHHFTPLGIVLGVIAVFGGMMFLATYLLLASRSAPDIPALLIGDRTQQR